ncbi:hypothetical protein WN48_05615 [Eufriesea mexicana]|uniref:Uncharacterized protein n=1 Tax=Eufriesea mexicana TaxID=516756 RepID=A0A310S960_9HYME|nr:hypothetical protein WN48_05615 [Eufriesea mexicana]
MPYASISPDDPSAIKKGRRMEGEWHELDVESEAESKVESKVESEVEWEVELHVESKACPEERKAAAKRAKMRGEAKKARSWSAGHEDAGNEPQAPAGEAAAGMELETRGCGGSGCQPVCVDASAVTTVATVSTRLRFSAVQWRTPHGPTCSSAQFFLRPPPIFHRCETCCCCCCCCPPARSHGSSSDYHASGPSKFSSLTLTVVHRTGGHVDRGSRKIVPPRKNKDDRIHACQGAGACVADGDSGKPRIIESVPGRVPPAKTKDYPGAQM